MPCCDAYDAMTTTRAYRAGAVARGRRGRAAARAGTQFDPAIVDAVLAALEPEWVATMGYAAASSPTSASLARR